MTTTNAPVARVSCAPDGCRWFDDASPQALGPVRHDGAEGGIELPELPAPARSIAWPIESMLVRPFRFPLNHPKLIDADMLKQELLDSSGADPGDWWLAWHAAPAEDGVHGLVFGLAEAERAAMRSAPGWQKSTSLKVDAWERLSRWLPDSDEGQTVGVIDQDMQGLFFGLYAGGTWLGMRRLNWEAEHSPRSRESVQSEILASLRSMGKDAALVTGRLEAAFVETWEALADRWQGETIGAGLLPDRHDANERALSNDAAHAYLLDFRHGRWRSRTAWSSMKMWKRPLQVITACMLIWLVGSGLKIAQLSAAIHASDDRLLAAFHAGLPQESVIIDPLAQLRRAAGGSNGGADAGDILRQMNSLAEVYRAHPWETSELSFRDGHAQMQGSVSDIQVLNAIRAGLQQQTGRDVKILDTDLAGQQVHFRMQW